MSRSHKHNPVLQTCVCRSEKGDKVVYHRKMRVAVRCLLALGDEAPPAVLFPIPDEVYDPSWTGGKDGKGWIGWKWMQQHPREMRK